MSPSRLCPSASRPSSVPNGAGKSTLIKVLAGEIVPTHGDVMLDGRSLKTFRAAELAARRAIVPQSTFLSFPFSVIEVVKLGASVPGFDQNPEHSTRIAEDALSDVGLTEFRDRLYSQLSGGERQRVHVARALCQLNAAVRRQGQTAVLLLDEPTSSLDLSHQSLVLGEARAQADEGRAVAVVLHDLNLAAAWADEIVLLSSGGIAARGPTIGDLPGRPVVGRVRMPDPGQYSTSGGDTLHAAAFSAVRTCSARRSGGCGRCQTVFHRVC